MDVGRGECRTVCNREAPRVLESPHDVDDAVHGLDVREEGVAEAVALGRIPNEAGNVHDIEERLDLADVASWLSASRISETRRVQEAQTRMQSYREHKIST